MKLYIQVTFLVPSPLSLLKFPILRQLQPKNDDDDDDDTRS